MFFPLEMYKQNHAYFIFLTWTVFFVKVDLMHTLEQRPHGFLERHVVEQETDL